MNASVAIQVLPSVQDEEEVIRIVDEVIDYIKSTGLNYYVGPCETSIEGDYDELMEMAVRHAQADHDTYGDQHEGKRKESGRSESRGQMIQEVRTWLRVLEDPLYSRSTLPPVLRSGLCSLPWP